MEERKLLFEGSEKRFFESSEEGTIIIRFKNTASAFGGIKKASVKDKGKYNCRISSAVFQALESNGVPTLFLKTISENEQLWRRLEMLPLEFIVRNRLAGTTAEMLGVENGTRIPNTVIEIRLHNDELGDPLINRHHVVALGIASYEELDIIHSLLKKSNEVMSAFFAKSGIELIDFKTEFGRTSDGKIIFADDITPDNTRLWDIETGEILDKDRFRHDYGEVSASYKEVSDRISKLQL